MTLNPPLARQHIAWCISTIHAIDRAALTDLVGREGPELEAWIVREIVRFCMRSLGTGCAVQEARTLRDGKRRCRVVR